MTNPGVNFEIWRLSCEVLCAFCVFYLHSRSLSNQETQRAQRRQRAQGTSHYSWFTIDHHPIAVFIRELIIIICIFNDTNPLKRSSLIRSLLLIIQLIWSGAVAAQIYSKARILTVENGLSDNRVNCFYKDRSGYIWIGTRNGLNRYDGHAFRVFRPSSRNSISNEVINSIAEDDKGTIWVGTMNGLNRYDPTLNHWETILPDPLKKSVGLPNNLVWDIQFSKEGLLWIASDVFEFSSYNPVSRQFTHYDWPGFAKTVPKTGASHYTSIHKFLAKSPYEFWLGTNRGLVHLDIRTGKSVRDAAADRPRRQSAWADARLVARLAAPAARR